MSITPRYVGVRHPTRHVRLGSPQKKTLLVIRDEATQFDH
jgi:hypothetical protein